MVVAVVVVVDGIKCRALLDTGSGSAYASVALVARLIKRPSHVEHRQIEMMLCSTVRRSRVTLLRLAVLMGNLR